MLKIIDERFHYEIIENGAGVWNLYFGDDLNRGEAPNRRENELVSSFRSSDDAMRHADEHAKLHAVKV